MGESKYAHVLKWAATVVIPWVASIPAVIVTLAMFSLVDFFMGLAAHFVRRDISSIEARKGGVKKLMTLALVIAIDMAGRHWQVDTHVTGLVCAYFLVVEGISIVENYAMAGMPVPEPVVLALVNVKRLMPRGMSEDEVRKALEASEGGGK